MKKQIAATLATAGLLLGATLSTTAMAAETQFVSIGTGGVTGGLLPNRWRNLPLS